MKFGAGSVSSLATTHTYDPSWVIADSDVMNWMMDKKLSQFNKWKSFIKYSLHHDEEFLSRTSTFSVPSAIREVETVFEFHLHTPRFYRRKKNFIVNTEWFITRSHLPSITRHEKWIKESILSGFKRCHTIATFDVHQINVHSITWETH